MEYNFEYSSIYCYQHGCYIYFKDIQGDHKSCFESGFVCGQEEFKKFDQKYQKREEITNQSQDFVSKYLFDLQAPQAFEYQKNSQNKQLQEFKGGKTVKYFKDIISVTWGKTFKIQKRISPIDFKLEKICDCYLNKQIKNYLYYYNENNQQQICYLDILTLNFGGFYGCKTFSEKHFEKVLQVMTKYDVFLQLEINISCQYQQFLLINQKGKELFQQILLIEQNIETFGDQFEQIVKQFKENNFDKINIRQIIRKSGEEELKKLNITRIKQNEIDLDEKVKYFRFNQYLFSIRKEKVVAYKDLDKIFIIQGSQVNYNQAYVQAISLEEIVIHRNFYFKIINEQLDLVLIYAKNGGYNDPSLRQITKENFIIIEIFTQNQQYLYKIYKENLEFIGQHEQKSKIEENKISNKDFILPGILNISLNTKAQQYSQNKKKQNPENMVQLQKKFQQQFIRARIDEILSNLWENMGNQQKNPLFQDDDFKPVIEKEKKTFKKYYNKLNELKKCNCEILCVNCYKLNKYFQKRIKKNKNMLFNKQIELFILGKLEFGEIDFCGDCGQIVDTYNYLKTDNQNENFCKKCYLNYNQENVVSFE